MEDTTPEQPVAYETESPAPVRRRRRRGWIWATGAVVLAGLVCGGVQLWANLDYDDAEAAFLQSREAAEPATLTLSETMDYAGGITDAAIAVDGVTSPELLSDADRKALGEAAAGLAQERDDAAAIGLTAPSTPNAKPLPAWELFPAASDLREGTAALDDRTDAQESAARSLSGTTKDLTELGTGILRSANEAVPAIEAATVEARFAPVIALRKAADSVQQESRFNEGASDMLLELDKAVIAVQASAKAERAAKAGPLFDARRKAETYARSLSGGVLLEFVWTESLLGQGAGDSAAGTATWDSEDGGTSHITLTNSVARYWPSDRMRSLVAHEVGHSISAKCYEKFDWERQPANEQWATAWAMSWGYSAYESGADEYGVPSKDMQAAAASCR
ncbi:hypothetical protein [Microbacterium sp. H1-D42]|uniref:hypothetical protein n=1 Tax=Microbacterium sp. H1-D42 TaxID=2925844 RepID=UPI001F52D13D|nr:hypothetical protein [Microbacterium sp. H1-D42]UNK72175.1 hypothetical protein MNR00_06955 [Microbacterium sp. H1-D42]